MVLPSGVKLTACAFIFVIVATITFLKLEKKPAATLETKPRDQASLWQPLQGAPVADVPYVVRDGHVVYGQSTPSETVLLDANPTNFVVASGWSNVWAKDRMHVYLRSYELTGADASSFNPVFDSEGNPSASYLKDKDHVYTLFPYSFPEIQRVAGADVSTFLAVNPPKKCGQQCEFDAEDHLHKYDNGFIVQ